MHPAVNALTSMLIAILGVAIVAVLVSQKAQTSSVLQAFGNMFSGILGTALSPITGTSGGGIGLTGGGSSYSTGGLAPIAQVGNQLP